ncbi:uncharacterized protein LOC109855983 isoform X3 [Pseudomyrmex gracilis]|uniref:uncharacterized protein LOC109855983 isoform X3 n=1 Tax=Pseudomyrmex gracilis TaxID=219809 RepID=UPI0009948F07|nr:uncharacterized protein LOC109855983 isoform X3 [Pseudomyrmex gracilis]
MHFIIKDFLWNFLEERYAKKKFKADKKCICMEITTGKCYRVPFQNREAHAVFAVFMNEPLLLHINRRPLLCSWKHRSAPSGDHHFHEVITFYVVQGRNEKSNVTSLLLKLRSTHAFLIRKCACSFHRLDYVHHEAK